jgi:ABC-type nitrate/sulfonate/bicarbonate transport system substrate-binding protein
MNKKFIIAVGPIFLIFSLPGLGQTVVRVGAFPNITHAQAMVGKANGWFEKALGPGGKIQWTSFNAGHPRLKHCFPEPSI